MTPEQEAFSRTALGQILNLRKQASEALDVAVKALPKFRYLKGDNGDHRHKPDRG